MLWMIFRDRTVLLLIPSLGIHPTPRIRQFSASFADIQLIDKGRLSRAANMLACFTVSVCSATVLVLKSATCSCNKNVRRNPHSAFRQEESKWHWVQTLHYEHGLECSDSSCSMLIEVSIWRSAFLVVISSMTVFDCVRGSSCLWKRYSGTGFAIQTASDDKKQHQRSMWQFNTVFKAVSSKAVAIAHCVVKTPMRTAFATVLQVSP